MIAIAITIGMRRDHGRGSHQGFTGRSMRVKTVVGGVHAARAITAVVATVPTGDRIAPLTVGVVVVQTGGECMVAVRAAQVIAGVAIIPTEFSMIKAVINVIHPAEIAVL